MSARVLAMHEGIRNGAGQSPRGTGQDRHKTRSLEAPVAAGGRKSPAAAAAVAVYRDRTPARPREGSSFPQPDELDRLETKQLHRLLLRLTGLKNTGRMSRELLLRAVAWHLQIRTAIEGDKSSGQSSAMGEAARAVERRNKAMLRAIKAEAEQRLKEQAAVELVGEGQGGATSADDCSLSTLQNPLSVPRKQRAPALPAKPLPPGSRLIREWRGETHEVIVQSDGTLLWRGKAWKSLSVIARTITGAAWSGPRFFGTLDKGQGDG